LLIFVGSGQANINVDRLAFLYPSQLNRYKRELGRLSQHIISDKVLGFFDHVDLIQTLSPFVFRIITKVFLCNAMIILNLDENKSAGWFIESEY
jgi:hypothetical protein